MGSTCSNEDANDSEPPRATPQPAHWTFGLARSSGDPYSAVRGGEASANGVEVRQRLGL